MMVAGISATDLSPRSVARFYALPLLRNQKYAGNPRASRPSPASDSRGLSTRVFPMRSRQARMKSAGTTG
jgi:hypothetical protein